MLALVLSPGGVGCGGTRAPAKPAPIDPKALAAELAGELAEVADVVHAHRDDCPALAGALRGVFARMRDSIAIAHRAQLDDATAKQLVIEMRAYDQVTAQHTAAIAADFTASATCANDREVRDVLMSMPTL
jgi:hypothetical protein